MFFIFKAKEPHMWDLSKGIPDEKVIDAQRDVLCTGSRDKKKVVLKLVHAIAKESVEGARVLCESGITNNICKCFVHDASEVQELALAALSALCDRPENCAAVVMPNDEATEQLNKATVVTHALRIVQAFDVNVGMAIDAALLLSKLAKSNAQEVAGQLSCVGALMRIVDACNTPQQHRVQETDKHQELQQLVLDFLHTLASRVGASFCRELGRTNGLGLLINLIEAHRAKELSMGDDGGRGRVTCTALSIIETLLLQVPVYNIQLQQYDGVQRLIAILRDTTVSWSVHVQAAAVLRAAASSPPIVQTLVTDGLDTVFAIVDRLCNARLGSLGLVFPSVSEPCTGAVVQQLLALVEAVGETSHAQAVLEGGRPAVLLTSLNNSLSDFTNYGDGMHLMLAACAQVLYRLSCQTQVVLPSSLMDHVAMETLLAVVSRAVGCTATRHAGHPQILYAAWCAVGILCKRFDDARRRNQEADVLGLMLDMLVAIVPVLLAAVGAVRPSGLTVANAVTYFAPRLENCTTILSCCLRLLTQLAQNPITRAKLLKNEDLRPAIRQILEWRYLRNSAKWLLSLLGEGLEEYQPFARYGKGLLFTALLESQGLQTKPFLDRGMDAGILVDLEDDFLSTDVGLDKIALLKVARIRAAHSMFTAMDMVDGRVDGCVYSHHVEICLQNENSVRSEVAAELRERMFTELEVHPEDPLNFMQFMVVYPWLAGMLPTVSIGPTPATVRSRKRAMMVEDNEGLEVKKIRV